MSESNHVTPPTSSVNDNDNFERQSWDIGFSEFSVNLSDWIGPRTMKLHENNPFIAYNQEQGPFPYNPYFGDQAGSDTTSPLAQESDQLAQNPTIQQMYEPTLACQVNEGSTFLAPEADEVAQYDDATSETYDLMARIGERAAKATSNKYPGYTPSQQQQQQSPQHVPDPVISAEDMLLIALGNDDSRQARVEADDGYGPENLASQALNTDWSSAQQSYNISLQHQPALLDQHQILNQLPQQSALQQPKATIQGNNKRKRNTDESTGVSGTPKRSKVIIERIVMKDGVREVCKSHVTPEYAAAVEKNERQLIKEVKSLKRLGLAKGLKAAKYKKRCRGDDCNQYETDCHCPGGFVN